MNFYSLIKFILVIFFIDDFFCDKNLKKISYGISLILLQQINYTEYL